MLKNNNERKFLNIRKLSSKSPRLDHKFCDYLIEINNNYNEYIIFSTLFLSNFLLYFTNLVLLFSN